VCFLADKRLYALDIRTQAVREWATAPHGLREGARLQFLDDISGPAYVALDQGIPTLATRIAERYGGCSRARSLWLVDGTATFYCDLDESAEKQSAWWKGPALPMPVQSFMLGRVFMRGENRRYGTTSCAMLYVAGGIDAGGRGSPALQCLVATGKTPHESWHFVTADNNGSPAVDSVRLPETLLRLPAGLSHGAALTAQWPEMLVTGARTTLIGKDPTGQTRCFYAAWRFQETVYGTDNQWREVPLPKGWPAIARLTAACAVDQHTTQQPQGPRLSRFLLDFRGFQADSQTFILQIAASTTFPALAAVALTPKERRRATRLFAALAARNEEEWESVFRKASASEFPLPPAGGVWTARVSRKSSARDTTPSRGRSQSCMEIPGSGRRFSQTGNLPRRVPRVPSWSISSLSSDTRSCT